MNQNSDLLQCSKSNLEAVKGLAHSKKVLLPLDLLQSAMLQFHFPL